jgi:hypothetical protein
LRENVRQRAERGIHDADPITETGQSATCSVARFGVAINAQQAQLRGRLQQRRGVTAAAKGGIDDHTGVLSGEKLDDFSLEHWYVKIVLGHL